MTNRSIVDDVLRTMLGKELLAIRSFCRRSHQNAEVKYWMAQAARACYAHFQTAMEDEHGKCL